MGDREYQLIRLRDSKEHHQTVNKWIDQATKHRKLLVINIDDYTNVHTRKRPLNGVSRAELDSSRPVNHPNGILIDDLVRNMSSIEQVTN